jgi:fatty acid synthase subunit alpha
LQPNARTESDGKGSYAMPKKLQGLTASPGLAEAAAHLAKQAASAASAETRGVGTDIELISAIPIDNEGFLERNFHQSEIDYCTSAPNPRASFAGRWALKEALFKSLGTEGKGAAAALKDIEVVATSTGPTIKLHGDAKAAADAAGIKDFKVSLSHTDDLAMAFVVALQ